MLTSAHRKACTVKDPNLLTKYVSVPTYYVKKKVCIIVSLNECIYATGRGLSYVFITCVQSFCLKCNKLQLIKSNPKNEVEECIRINIKP